MPLRLRADVVVDAGATADLFDAWVPELRGRALPVALVAQDGLTPGAAPWTRIDALFVGGTTAWKLGPRARALAIEAKRRGKWLHMGRVNSLHRLQLARRLGCDSVDGSSWARWRDTWLPAALEWLARPDGQSTALSGGGVRVYLGGPINGCTDEEAHGWREAAKVVLAERGHSWLDPMTRDYRGRELEPGIAAEIVEQDKADIRNCDVLLMSCPRPSYGTAMEISYGHSLGLPVIAVLPEGAIQSPWVIYHAEIYFGSVTDAIKEIL